MNLLAKHLESIGDTSNAVKQYELSDTHTVEVPRMLTENLEDLEAYVNEMKDKKLLEWWARYTESKGNFDKALEYYSKAEDFLSIVR